MKYEFKTEEHARKAFDRAFSTYSDYAKNVAEKKWKAPKCEIDDEDCYGDESFSANFVKENITIIFYRRGKVLHWAACMDNVLSLYIDEDARMYGKYSILDKFAQLSILRQFESIAFGAVSEYAEDKKDCDLKCSFVFRTYDGE